MKLTIKAIVLATTLALPTFFAGSAFAIPACGSCVGGAQPASHASYGVTNSTLCTNCHTAAPAPAPTPTPTPAPKPTPAPVTPVVTPPTTATVAIHATSKSCGACVKGTAPSSVSAHRNVNSTMTACVACHSGGSTSGTGGSTGSTGSTGGSTGGTSGSTGGHTGGMTGGHSDDNHSTTGGSTSGHSEHRSSGGKNHRHDD
jgi:hypothetical protein